GGSIPNPTRNEEAAGMATTDYAISLASVQAAAQRIDGLAHRTPVLTCHALEDVAMAAAGAGAAPKRLFFKVHDCEVSCDCENLQKVGAFKYRGALNAVKKHLQEQPSGGDMTFVTHSSGNHAQALALAARDAHCKAVVVMPENSPQVKQRAVRGYGAEVVLCAPTVQAREDGARAVEESTGAYFVHPSNDPDVMSGQGTVALELLEQAKQQFGVQLDAILVPIGGGGLCSGVAMAAKVFAVEPVGAADAFDSFQKRQLTGQTGPVNTVADGLRSTLGEEPHACSLHATKPTELEANGNGCDLTGDNNWPVIRDFVDEVLLVSDEEIVAAMKLIWERMKLVVEPSGAVPAAAVLFNKLPASAEIKNVGIVFSGGNVDLEKLPWSPNAST
ncbi:hypothetical protein BBJ28_00022154, partial [Nothophytophthora sp. Chile5]